MRILLSILLVICFIYPPSVQASGPDGYLIIESISLFKSIGFIPDSDLSPLSHYYDLSSLNYGIGRLEHFMWGNTVGGRTVLVGHTPGGFSFLDAVSIDDKITISMEGNYYEYKVFEIYTTTNDDNSVLNDPPPEFELVLITCKNKYERLIVKAK